MWAVRTATVNTAAVSAVKALNFCSSYSSYSASTHIIHMLVCVSSGISKSLSITLWMSTLNESCGGIKHRLRSRPHGYSISILLASVQALEIVWNMLPAVVEKKIPDTPRQHWEAQEELLLSGHDSPKTIFIYVIIQVTTTVNIIIYYVFLLFILILFCTYFYFIIKELMVTHFTMIISCIICDK